MTFLGEVLGEAIVSQEKRTEPYQGNRRTAEDPSLSFSD